MLGQTGVNFHQPLLGDKVFSCRGEYFLGCSRLGLEHHARLEKSSTDEIFVFHVSLLVGEAPIELKVEVLQSKKVFPLRVQPVGCLDQINHPSE